MTDHEASNRLVLSDDPPTVSVPVPSFNERGRSANIEAIPNSNNPDEFFETIVKDDGRTDGTKRVVSGFCDRGVEVYPRPNGEKHAALNLGLPSRNGETVVPVDAASRGLRREERTAQTG